MAEAAAEGGDVALVETLAAHDQDLMLEQRAHEGGERPIVEGSEIDIADLGTKRLSCRDDLDEAAFGASSNVASETHLRHLPSFTNACKSTIVICRGCFGSEAIRGRIAARSADCRHTLPL
ncbi:uroporphyrinogen-III synthase [Bradyrhizobium oligotrophicum S58]|uniref:Uroporphyrinogen-III synthase n=1 Tax=Bradyrhizobium oligotrophicum S58 TaxID=1245469 RepID=M4Z7S9_9BRAD|nr:uroporphyrinogen-III synthase [Bradyrhizobium oligotrophicum S58]